MPKEIIINDCELPIMKALWQKDGATSPEIFDGIHGNKSTLRTLLARLVERGAVRAEGINRRTYCYFAVLTQAEYIRSQRKTFLEKVFDGSAEKMLLNFVQDEDISPQVLERLIQRIGGE